MLNRFGRIYILDTEYQKPDGERTLPVCAVFYELYSQQKIEAFFDKPCECPIQWREDDLVVGYNLAAEWGVFIALGWRFPPQMIDLYFEHLREMNGAKKTGLIRDFGLLSSSVKLNSALRLIGREDLIHEDKNREREYVIANGIKPPASVSMSDHKRRILDYCATDVRATIVIFAAFEPLLTTGNVLNQALVRGRFSVPVAHFEQNGMPLDVPNLASIQKHRKEIVEYLINTVERENKYGIFKPGGVLSSASFHLLVERFGLSDSWPRTDSGAYKRDKDTMKMMSEIRKELEPLRQLLKVLPQLRSTKLAVGSDGRSRPPVWPFMQAAGRCNPRGDCILGQTAGLRYLIRADPGFAIVAVDASQEEYGLAAALSEDKAMRDIYDSGEDQYLAFAKSAGAVPLNGTKKSHPKERNLYKTVQLATQYGIGGVALSQRLGLGSPLKAETLIGHHYQSYPRYWEWSRDLIEQAYRNGFIESPLGWRLWVCPQTKKNSLLNFPVQSGGADVLRVACILAVERGLGNYLCYPHHDAVYAHCPIELAPAVAEILAECFKEAGKIVTGDETFDLRCGKPEICEYPDSYEPGKGTELWGMIQEFLYNMESQHNKLVFDDCEPSMGTSVQLPERYPQN